MSRRNDSKSLIELILLFAALLTVVTKFLIEVNRHGLWKECIVSVLITGGVNYFLFCLADSSTIPFSVFGWSVIISIVAFCVYWSHLFDNSSFGQFSKGSLKRNLSNWQKQQWWWTLDGWQFEEEVAKIFILMGYKATVTKGSGDGGVDIILKKDGYCAIVQCKHYQNPVPPEPIRALWGCKDDFNADEVILVASSGITEAGAKFVQNKPNFRVMNLDDIIMLANQTEQSTRIEQTAQKISLQNNANNNQAANKNRIKPGRKIDI